MARRRVWTAWMIALVAFLTLLGSARALHNTPAPTPAPSSTDHHNDDEHHVEIVPHVFCDKVRIESVKGIPHLPFIIFGEGGYS